MIRLAVRTVTPVRAACCAAKLPFKRGASAGPLSTFLWIGVLTLVVSACGSDRSLAPQVERPVAHVRLAASLAAYPQVSAGAIHNCVVKTDRTIACWGWDYYGQSTPPTGTFTQVSGGGRYTCAVKTDATLACWGGNHPYYGQVTTPPPGTFTQVSVGNSHACAVKTDKTLACWGGSNGYGEETPPTTGTFTQVSAGGYHTCALKTDGTLACWGWNLYGQAAPPTSSTFTQVSANWYYTCGVKTDRTLACWGASEAGGVRRPVTPPSGTFMQVSAGLVNACAVKTDGTLACWGEDWFGAPPTGSFTQVSVGWYHVCAVKTGGTIVCWGWNDHGQATPPSLNSAPVANAGPDQTAEATSSAGAAVALNGAGSSDADNEPLTYTWTGPFGTASGASPNVTLPLGTHTVTLTVSDGQATSTDDVQITIHDTTAPETVIAAANDGTGAALLNGASTLSSAVTIVFGGSDAVGVSGFECSVDAAPYSSCTSPAVYTGLAVGSHVFGVRALDVAGNLDGSPANFTWAVITPAMATENLITAIDNMWLASGVAYSLTGLLGEVSKLLNDRNPNNDGAACNKLDAFLTQVGIKEANGQLTAAQASQLHIAATAIKLSLGC